MYEINIFSTALCNLACEYCYISKDSDNILADNEIKESFIDSNYYYNLLCEHDSRLPSQVTDLSVWGGEPYMFIERTYDTLRTFIKNCPSLNHFHISSNFTNDKMITGIQGLMDVFKDFPDREFVLTQQISIDGPDYITDLSRGKGTTKKILKNYKYLVENNFFKPLNVKVECHVKATLNSTTLKMLDKKEALELYYNFFIDNFDSKFIVQGGFNLASPGNYTQLDGVIYSRIIEMAKHINKIPYYHNNRVILINPIVPNVRLNSDTVCIKCGNPAAQGGFCHIGINSLCLLPRKKICWCIQTFKEYCKDYSKLQSDDLMKRIMICDVGDYTHKNRMLQFYNETQSPTAYITSSALNLKLLALNGLVDSKYLSLDECIKGIKKYLTTNLDSCIKCNFETMSICNSLPFYALKLAFNGVIDQLEDEE